MPFLVENSEIMTSLKPQYLKNFPTDFFETLSQYTSINSLQVPKIWRACGAPFLCYGPAKEVGAFNAPPATRGLTRAPLGGGGYL